MVKGFLESSDGRFQLAPKVTTIGREGCDLTIQSGGVDFQHAVIEFSLEEGCFVLQDLNTQHGTYINDCRVQNAAVRLAPNDQIRFGASGVTYELIVEGSALVSIPPVHQRAQWSQPQHLTILSDHAPPVSYYSDSLPHLQNVVRTSTSVWANQQQNLPPQQQVPRPPVSMRARPLSAGNAGLRRVASHDRIHTMQNVNSNVSPPMQHRTVTGSGWVTTGGTASRPVSSQNEITSIQDKEQRLLRLTEEVKRLAMYEGECARKEEVIHTLREEIADLQGRLRHLETSRGTMDSFGDAELANRVILLENELRTRKGKIEELEQEVGMLRREAESGSGGSNCVSRQELNDRIKEINSLKAEMERMRKDKNITSGLVTQMQKDMSSKDTTISRLTREIETMRSESEQRNVQLSSMQMKFKRVEESRKTDEEFEVKEKELAALRIKHKSAENRMQEQTDLISSLKSEVEKVKASAQEEKDSQKKIQGEMDALFKKCQDYERSDRMVRVDLEQLSKKLERFRQRVVQVTFSTPGIKAPDGEISDDELMTTLKKLMDERTELTRSVQDLNESVKTATASKKEMTETTKKMKQQLNESMSRLGEKGRRSPSLKQEIDVLQCVSVDDSTSWARDAVVSLLQAEMAWTTQIEAAIEKCGINVKISEGNFSQDIDYLQAQGRELMAEKITLVEQLASSEERYKADLEVTLTALKEELLANSSSEVEKIKLESEEKMNKAIDEIRALEMEKKESAVQIEVEKIAVLEASMVQLKASLLEKEEEQTALRESTKTSLQQIESYKALEKELREQITSLEKGSTEEVASLQRQVAEKDSRFESSVASYKEEINQHSVTICAMEERLNKVVNKAKDVHAENTQLKKTISELRTKRPVSPTKVIVTKTPGEIVAMETLIAELKSENARMKNQMTEQQNVITGLRRDLTGASARLSDVTGELSEKQKEEVEHHKMAAIHKQSELVELRQQMAKLSQIIDKQTTEMKELQAECSKQKSMLSKYKNITNEKESLIKDLEVKLTTTSKEQQEKLEAMTEEGQITSELTSVGAQCRGERHDQVIERQREALTELRARIRALEQTRPAVPNHDAALQQVILLKKELAELKAKQAISDTSVSSVINSAVLARQVEHARGGVPSAQDRAEVEMERSSHRETIESLELSETSFLTLLRAVASALELEDIGGLRSMAHIPKDERHILIQDRERSVEMLGSRIKVLKERIARKDELLQGYERDLSKLRQAEVLADQRNAQVEHLSSDIRSRTEESQYLRESLQRTRNKLEQEKRLNTAIKQKKTYHLENEHMASQKISSRKPHCEISDPIGQGQQRRKLQNEKVKRKNYEIKVLKGELATRDRDLSDTKRKLMTMGNNIDFEEGCNHDHIIEAP